MSRQAQLLALWAISSFIAAFVALQFSDAAYEEQTGTWVPVSNDSFYHARRIVDAATTVDGLYQFDTKMHVPEGSWINWPWAYDWSMAQGLKLWLKLNPGGQPMAFLAHVPVYWAFINAALLLGICVMLQLSVPWIAMVLFAYAISPLTMFLHGVGIIDHHYIEYTLVLLTVLNGLRWLKSPDQLARAVLLGITLGAAPAFHTGLFILQAPVLATLWVLWVRGMTPGRDSMLALSTSLILTSVAVLLPSEAFRAGFFQFAVLSWFHLYIAATSTLLIAGFARFSFTPKNLGWLMLIGVLLLIPIWNDTIGGAAFLSGEITLLDKITEAKSPLAMAEGPGGIASVVSYYSLLGLIAPLLIPVYLWSGYRARNPADVFLAVMVVFGVALLLTQFRLHYFGSFALVLGWVLIASKKLNIADYRPLLTLIAGLILIGGASYSGITNKMMVRYPLGQDPAYEDTFSLFGTLIDACNKDPGIAFADNNFGHYIRYHTNCSVIANNFLMTPLHERKIREMQQLANLSPEEFLEAAPPDVKYIFARLVKFYGRRENGEFALTSTEYLKANNPRLFFELNSRDDLPERYRVLNELPLDENRGLVRARVIEILPAE